MKFRLQSLNDVVTNSSMEVYQEATQYTVDAVRDIINVILKIGGSDKSCDDLFTVSINYKDMLESYFEDILGKSDIDEEYLGMIEEVRSRKDDNGYFISNSKRTYFRNLKYSRINIDVSVCFRICNGYFVSLYFE